LEYLVSAFRYNPRCSSEPSANHRSYRKMKKLPNTYSMHWCCRKTIAFNRKVEGESPHPSFGILSGASAFICTVQTWPGSATDAISIVRSYCFLSKICSLTTVQNSELHSTLSNQRNCRWLSCFAFSLLCIPVYGLNYVTLTKLGVETHQSLLDTHSLVAG